MSNTLGNVFKLSVFGESHGPCIGVVIDGCPAGIPLDIAEIQRELDLRRPIDSKVSTTRREGDRVELLSGIYNDKTTGAPLTFIVWNSDVNSDAYKDFKSIPRPGHADFTATIKYGGYNDLRGGGMFSGRLTATYVIAGAVAQKILSVFLGIEILSHTLQIGNIFDKDMKLNQIKLAVKNQLFCADKTAARKMLKLINEARKSGDSIGGIVEVIALNVPAGLGEPVFDTLEGELSKAFFAIPAVKGVEFGSGFKAATMRGSEHNDAFTLKKNQVITKTNNAGGILGGISSGMPIIARIAIKPTPSISRIQKTLNLTTGKETELKITGRHDVCIVPRAVPVAKAMMAIVLCDMALRAQLIPRVYKK